MPLLPDYAGLLVVDEYGRIETVKAPPRIHKDPLHELAFNLQDKFYYNWRNTLDALERGNKDETIRRLRGEVQWLTAEYKAATGYDISECF